MRCSNIAFHLKTRVKKFSTKPQSIVSSPINIEESTTPLPPIVHERTELPQSQELSPHHSFLLSLAPANTKPYLRRQYIFREVLQQRALDLSIETVLKCEYSCPQKARQYLYAAMASCLDSPYHTTQIWNKIRNTISWKNDPLALVLYLRSCISKPEDAVSLINQYCPFNDFSNLPDTLIGFGLQACLLKDPFPTTMFKALLEVSTTAVFNEVVRNRQLSRYNELLEKAMACESIEPLILLMHRMWECKVKLSTAAHASLLKHFHSVKNNERILLTLYNISYQEKKAGVVLNNIALASICDEMLSVHESSDWMKLLTATKTYLRIFEVQIPSTQAASTITQTALNDSSVETATEYLETLISKKHFVTGEQILLVLSAAINEQKLHLIRPILNSCYKMDYLTFSIESVRTTLESILTLPEFCYTWEGNSTLRLIGNIVLKLASSGKFSQEDIDSLIRILNLKWNDISGNFGVALHYCKFGFNPFRRIRPYGRESDIRIQVLHSLVSLNREQAQQELDHLADRCLKTKSISKMKAILTFAEHNSLLSLSIRHSAIRLYTELNGWSSLLHVHNITKNMCVGKETPSFDVWGETLSLNAVLLAAFETGNWSELLTTLRLCRTLAVQPFETVLRKLLYGAAGHSAIAVVHEILGHLQTSDKMQISILDFDHVLWKLSQKQCASGILEVLETMTEFEIRPTLDIFNRLIEESLDIKYAFAILAFLLEDKALQPDLRSITPIVKRMGDLPEVTDQIVDVLCRIIANPVESGQVACLVRELFNSPHENLRMGVIHRLAHLGVDLSQVLDSEQKQLLPELKVNGPPEASHTKFHCADEKRHVANKDGELISEFLLNN